MRCANSSRCGALGPLLGIRISCRRDLRDAWISRRDWRGRMPHPYLLDMAIHHVDLLRMITGARGGRGRRAQLARAGLRPSSTTRRWRRSLRSPTAHLSRYEGTWAEPLVETSWNGDWELVGSRGRATWSGGVDDALRGTVWFGRHRRACRPRRPARRCGRSTGSASSPSCAGRSPPATQPECSAADNLRSLAVDLRARPLDRGAPARAVEEVLAV